MVLWLFVLKITIMRKVKNVAAMFAAVEAVERGSVAPAVGAPFAFGGCNYSYSFNNTHMGTASCVGVLLVSPHTSQQHPRAL